MFEEWPSDYGHANDSPFKDLMSRRIREILLICSGYDRFMLEEDGRIDEQLFQEYVSLKLRYPPMFTQASTSKEAMDRLSVQFFDLVIVMLSVGEATALEAAREIKNQYPDKPVVLLTPLSTKETRRVLKMTDDSPLDLIFSWQGNTNVMLAMVKLLEDRMNLDRDVTELGVPCIILVEDSVRYYSSYLPMIYETLIRQARNAMKEGLNEWEQTLRMRSRPKILLAVSYEEAIELYEKYRENLLGVITDVSYKKDLKINNRAGLLLCQHIRGGNSELPILVQSSNIDHKPEALEWGAEFIHKHSKTLLKDLEIYLRTQYGFGDFVFRDPVTREPISYARDLKSLQRTLCTVNDEIFAFHVGRNDFSQWLRARALFALARQIRKATEADFGSLQEFRDFIINSIKDYRMNRGRGVIAEFDRQSFDEVTFFSRIGSGSLGGKGRGLAFVDQELKKHQVTHRFPGVTIAIPRSIVLTTDVFDEFMANNNLYHLALKDNDDEVIRSAFLEAAIPKRFNNDIQAILKEITTPLAVRSSSLLEDSQHQPFAGIYDTCMIPNNAETLEVREEQLKAAIKMVYASTYSRQSKAYMKSTNNMLEDEKMAVIIQEVTGESYGEWFYPQVSGVARSLNFYPIPPEKAEDGIADIAFGLGKTVVDGGTALRFSPAFPRKILQLTSTDATLATTQNTFFALNLNNSEFSISKNSDRNLLKLDIQDVDGNGSLAQVASTYDFADDRIRDGVARSGTRLITMAGILKYGAIPLAEILQQLLALGQQVMNVPIEIEFALNWSGQNLQNAEFSFLQIRPIVENNEYGDTHVEPLPPENVLLFAEKAMGNGLYSDIADVVYVKLDGFDRADMKAMGPSLSQINRKLEEEGRGYLLIVLGRLGSTDPWLGIPLGWADISSARVIVESGTRDFRVEPSQGTHFFQNITSLGCGYLTINPDLEDGIFEIEELDRLQATWEDEYIRSVRFDSPLLIKIDGKNSRAIISV
ncbi:MAG: phosphoenolpyruvate synthase [Spirochaetales bacterium]|nr:phosphoenolpyruvate synthase [Spirochaetales bacterium]